MKFIIKFLGWVTFLLIAFSFLGSFLPSQTSNTDKEPQKNTSPEITKSTYKLPTLIDSEYIYTCVEIEGVEQLFSINKKMSFIYGNSHKIKENYDNPSVQEVLKNLGCSIVENTPNKWNELTSGGVKPIETITMANSKGKRFNTCKALGPDFQNKKTTIYFLGRCPKK